LELSKQQQLLSESCTLFHNSPFSLKVQMGDILQRSFAMLSFFPILEIFPSSSSWASPSSVSLCTNKKLEKSLENPCQETHQEIHLPATALDKEFLFWSTSHGFLLAKKHKDFFSCKIILLLDPFWTALFALSLCVFGLVPFLLLCRVWV